MPTTARNHFRQDIARARGLVAAADPMPAGTPAEQLLRDDLLRAGWMFAVGALDAYFSDAYTDVVAATIISKERHPPLTLPKFFLDIRFPVRALLQPYKSRPNWRWRMAARRMMDRNSVLSLKAVHDTFNKFFRKGDKFFREVIPGWIAHPDATLRMLGVIGPQFAALSPADQKTAADRAVERMEDRFQTIFQRRHDCIHNCDRPKVSPQFLSGPGTVRDVIDDIDFLVSRCDEHIDAEFRQFLLGCGCPPAVIAQAGY
ncbi:MAG: hypothetical protein K2X82_29215 [Gemmataceae bacterium]|nr:hypothetical protein [Gemmataceae bacterium]